MSTPVEAAPEGLPFDHHGAAYNEDPLGTYRELRERCPVSWTGAHGGYWALTRAEDVHRAAVEHGTFSSERLKSAPNEMRLLIPPIENPLVPVNETDPPEFQKYRRLVNKLLSPAAVKSEFAPMIRRWTTHAIDAFVEAGEADLIYDFAAPVPACVTLEWLGFESGDWRRFAAAIHDYSVALPGTPLFDAAIQAQSEMYALLRETITARRSAPGDDLVTHFVNAEIDGRPLGDDAVFGILQSLIAGGVDTTASLVGSTLVHLADHPETRQRLIDDPGLWPTATEEFLRMFPPVMAHGRTITTDTEIGGCPVRQGDAVLVSWAAANHDPEAFPEPDRLILDRTPNRHYSFGMGVHRCAGSHLARATFVEMMTQLLERLPDYEIVDRERLEPYPDRAMFFGWTSVPARFTPGSRS